MSCLVPGTGMCPSLLLDLHRFLAAKQLIDENATNRLSGAEITDLKLIVASSAKVSARITLVFKAGRLRTATVESSAAGTYFVFC